jgi:hypothetical protein
MSSLESINAFGQVSGTSNASKTQSRFTRSCSLSNTSDRVIFAAGGYRGGNKRASYALGIASIEGQPVRASKA